MVKGGAGNDEVGGGTETTRFMEELEMTRSGEAKETMWSPAAKEMIKFGAAGDDVVKADRRCGWRRNLNDKVRGGAGDDKVWEVKETMWSKAEPEMTKLAEELETTRFMRSWRRQSLGRRRRRCSHRRQRR